MEVKMQIGNDSQFPNIAIKQQQQTQRTPVTAKVNPYVTNLTG
jgi:hypothetical protein